MAQFERGDVTEDDLPRNILVELLSSQDEAPIAPDVLIKEIGFSLLAPSLCADQPTHDTSHRRRYRDLKPLRALREGEPPWGLTFGIGVHTCLGQYLDGGIQPRANTGPLNNQYGIVPLLVQELFKRKAHPNPTDPARSASQTERAN